MQTTRLSEIAIDVLCACAERNAIKTAEAACRAKASKDHTAQVVRRLVNAGYLCSARGRSGGIALTSSPEAIKVSDILRVMQPELLAFENMREQSNLDTVDARLAGVVAQAHSSFLEVLDRCSIADLVN